MTKRSAAGILCLALLTAAGLPAQKRRSKKPDEEPKPQILAPLPDTPEAIAVDTGRLSFQVSPLSDKGLLSQQVRDALKAVTRLNHGATIVKLRAFVAGSGDLRRVKEIVAADFTERKQPLPTISTLQVGALPMRGAQVVLEAISSEKKTVNPAGLAFAAPQAPGNPAAALSQLRNTFMGADVTAAQVLHVTCFLGSLEDEAAARAAVAAAFPSASFNFVQRQRLAVPGQAACEGVGQPSQPQQTPREQPGLAFVNAPKLILTATQLVFRDRDADFRLAYQRLAKTIAALGAAPEDVVWTGAYVLTTPDAARIATIQPEFIPRPRAPAGHVVQVEGLPSTDATAAIELIAVGH